MKYLLTLFSIVSFMSLQAQISRHNALIDGQRAYENEDYASATEFWKDAEANAESIDVKSQFNIGLAQYKQDKIEESIETWKPLTKQIQNKSLRSDLYQNLGNAYGKTEKWEEAVKMYREALKNNPRNEEARYGLSQALRKLKKQNENQQNQKDGEKDKQKQDQQNENKQDQQGGNQDQKDQNKKDGQGQEQEQKDQAKDDQNSDQSNSGDEGEPKEDEKRGEGAKADEQREGKEQNGQLAKRIPEKEAEMMLEAIAKQEKATNAKMNKKKMKGKSVKTDKDW